LRKYVLKAIDSYVKAAGGFGISTLLNNSTDISSGKRYFSHVIHYIFNLLIFLEPFGSILPLVPNVTIQYRCGDNIGFGKTRYGLLPFSAFRPPRINPNIAKFIYVIADSPGRQSYHAFSSRCGIILQSLYGFLKKTFPSSVIVIKRGGDPFLDYARIAYSNITICSASTFCLWPALSNTIGTNFIIPY
jgi:hypothetical protein